MIELEGLSADRLRGGKPLPNSPRRDTEGLFDIVGWQDGIGSWGMGEVVDDLDDPEAKC